MGVQIDVLGFRYKQTRLVGAKAIFVTSLAFAAVGAEMMLQEERS